MAMRYCIALPICFLLMFPVLCQDAPLPSPSSPPARLKEAASQPTERAVLSSPIPTPQPNPEKVVLCLVDDRRLTLAKVNRMLDRLLKDKKGTQEHLDQMRFVYTQNIMQEWLDTNLLAVEAETEGIRVTEEEITAQEQELKKASKVKFEVDEALARLGLDKEEYHAQMRDAILGEKLIRRRFSAYYSEKDLQEIYKANPAFSTASPRESIPSLLSAQGN